MIALIVCLAFGNNIYCLCFQTLKEFTRNYRNLFPHTYRHMKVNRSVIIAISHLLRLSTPRWYRLTLDCKPRDDNKVNMLWNMKSGRASAHPVNNALKGVGVFIIWQKRSELKLALFRRDDQNWLRPVTNLAVCSRSVALRWLLWQKGSF